MADGTRYLLVSPGRNEADYMRETLDSVVAQTLRPTKWVIVDDGSTDDTPAILADYARQHPWITVVTCRDRGHRSVGPGVIEAFYAGYDTVDPADYDFIGKLDLDLRLPPRYFERLIERMEAEPRIATCSGRPHLERGDKLVQERHGYDTSLGATKFYRREAFETIGGFIRGVAWDGIDCHLCRMHGWIACNFDEPDLRVVHLRPMGSTERGILTGRARSGYGQWFMGTAFSFLMVSVVYRLTQRPYLIGSVAMLWGYLKSAVLRKPRYDNPEFRAFLRRYHRRVLRVGKDRAVSELIAPTEPTWH
ncbi:glycosyltransferase family 2 protein [soil metagenome]